MTLRLSALRFTAINFTLANTKPARLHQVQIVQEQDQTQPLGTQNLNVICTLVNRVTLPGGNSTQLNGLRKVSN
jgi:hypothetical protein